MDWEGLRQTVETDLVPFRPLKPAYHIAATLVGEIDMHFRAVFRRGRCLGARSKFMPELNENNRVAATSLRLKIGRASCRERV